MNHTKSHEHLRGHKFMARHTSDAPMLQQAAQNGRVKLMLVCKATQAFTWRQRRQRSLFSRHRQDRHRGCT